MSEYITEVNGSASLDEIERAIAGEEVAGAEFLRAGISFHDDNITNLVTFNDLPPGHRPASRLTLVLQGSTPPDKKKTVWAGVLLVAGTNRAVVAYR